jgi:hypothetical protein
MQANLLGIEVSFVIPVTAAAGITLYERSPCLHTDIKNQSLKPLTGLWQFFILGARRYVMRNSKDRRGADAIASFPLEDNDRERVFAERRKHGERRIDNLAEEERQLLLSEMPAPTSGNRRR